MKKKLQTQKGLVLRSLGEGGFTLIEILVVIGIIAILAVIVLIAINPGRQFAQSRDTQRQSNLNALLNAIGQKMADNKGQFNVGGCPSLPSSAESIHSAGSAANTVNLSCLVPTYLSSLPIDPSNPTSPDTGYQVYADSNGRIHVLAQTTETSIPRTTALEIIR